MPAEVRTRLLVLSVFLAPLMAGIGGATAATKTAAGPAETCASPDCPITINDNDTPAVQDRAATPYPSVIQISRVDCCIIKSVTVTLTGFTHASPEDIDVLLVREFGSEVDVVELMSDVGARLLPAAGLSLTFDDAASASLPTGLPLASGTYRPTNYPGTATPCVTDAPPSSANADPFPPPAPVSPSGGYFETLSVFHGRIDSGSWRLYVGDDCAGGSGSIASWSLGLTFLDCYPLCLIKRADSVRVDAGSPIGFTLQAFNDLHQFPPEEYLYYVDLDDPLPSGPGIDWSISPAYSGPGSCSITGAVGSQNLSCDFGGFFPGDYAQVHVSTATQACGSHTNTATLSGFSPTQPSEVREDTSAIRITGCPTAVRLGSFAATPSKRGVLLRWQTASEAGLLGFDVYRERRGRLVKLTRTPVPSVFAGSTHGHGYSLLDRSAPRSGMSKYRLQALGLDGTRRWLGAAVISR